MSGRDAAWLPLRGVRVLDFTWMIAGPLGTRLLANFGADVIKVESYNRVDRIRETGPHPDGPWSYNEDGSFNDVNLNKRSLLLNLNLPRGRALARQLTAVADVVMANFTGDRLDRWELGFADLAAVRPDIIVLNMPVFESQGERRRWGGIGTHINGLAGISSLSGYEGDPPFGLGPLYPDFSGNPFHATSAILAALIERDRGAGAQFIEISQYESTASLLGPALLAHSVAGSEPQRRGNHSDRACPHNVYPVQGEDRWIAIAVESDGEWAALCRALGQEAWCTDPRFASLPARLANEAALDELIAADTSDWTAARLAAHLQAAGVPAAPVSRLDEVLADPWYRREYFYEQRGPEGCVFTTHGEPIRPAGEQQPALRAPLMGEHTDTIVRELLGLDSATADALYADGTLG
ncbi:MAG TPA: CoA transferase [Dehalococcoidia bacterium]|nr:CoA transferase [Dehalococcoidia bacterium]